MKLPAAQKSNAPKKCGLNIFTQSMQNEVDVEASRIKQGLHPRVQVNLTTSRRVTEDMEALQKEDPSVFQFDELIEGDGRKRESIEGLEQKKRVGLFVPSGGPLKVQSSQYISQLERRKEFRDMEKEIIEQRVINRDRKKEKDAHEDKEVFVTSAYKDRLKEREEFQRELALKEKIDDARDASKMEHGFGFAALHRNMLEEGLRKPVGDGVPASDDTGASSSSANLKEESAVKSDIKEERTDVKDDLRGLKREISADVAGKRHKVEQVQLKEKQEQDEIAENEKQNQRREKEKQEQQEREEKANSARERYLARKKASV